MNASSTAPAISSTRCTVRADLVTDARIGGWSSSCRLPMPQRFAGARPPTTTSGEPLNCAWVTALTPLVTPGPAVSTASPGTRVSLPTASAANTAVCSCRTSRIRIGGVGLDRAVVHREDVGAGEREHRVHAVRGRDGDGVLAAVRRLASGGRLGRGGLGDVAHTGEVTGW